MRKACAEVFIDVAAACTLAVRHSHLTKTFVQLLDDNSRWVRRLGWSKQCGCQPVMYAHVPVLVVPRSLVCGVTWMTALVLVNFSLPPFLLPPFLPPRPNTQVRKAAYQSLGPFITTFKEEEGEDAEGAQLSSLDKTTSSSELRPVVDCTTSGEGVGRASQQTGGKETHSDTSEPVSCPENASLETVETWIEKQLKVVSLTECVRACDPDGGGGCEATEYNDVLYWRQPIPDLDLNLLNDSSSRLLSTEEPGRRKDGVGEEEREEKVMEKERGEGENGAAENEGEGREDKRQVREEESSKDAPSLEDKDIVEDRFVVHFEDDVISDSAVQVGPTGVHNLLRTSSHEVLMHSTPAPHNNLASSSDMELTIQMDHSSQQPLPVSRTGVTALPYGVLFGTRHKRFPRGLKIYQGEKCSLCPQKCTLAMHTPLHAYYKCTCVYT